jgi:hypothetical protein
MTDILPPIKGKKIDKLLGNGSVAVITDECLFTLKPYIVNGIKNCIHLSCVEDQLACNVRPGMSSREINELLKVMRKESDDKPITTPMWHRDIDDAWITAADIFDALAAACRGQISRPNLKNQGPTNDFI